VPERHAPKVESESGHVCVKGIMNHGKNMSSVRGFLKSKGHRILLPVQPMAQACTATNPALRPLYLPCAQLLSTSPGLFPLLSPFPCSTLTSTVACPFAILSVLAPFLSP